MIQSVLYSLSGSFDYCLHRKICFVFIRIAYDKDCPGLLDPVIQFQLNILSESGIDDCFFERRFIRTDQDLGQYAPCGILLDIIVSADDLCQSDMHHVFLAFIFTYLIRDHGRTCLYRFLQSDRRCRIDPVVLGQIFIIDECKHFIDIHTAVQNDPAV